MDNYNLVDDCAKGEPKAQRELYNKFSRKMYGVCLRYAKNNEDANDILQDGFVKIFQKIVHFKKEGSLEGWIRRIIVNTALDRIRKYKKEEKNIQVEQVDFMISKESFIIENLIAEDLLKMLQKLPIGYKTVFNLFAIEGYSHKEIGEKLGISENTSKSQFSRAKKSLQDMIKSTQK